jgi:HEPN domain-containing protein/predicted nucleotidyltransferase
MGKMSRTKNRDQAKAEEKVIFALTCGFSSLGNFPIGFSELKRMTGLSTPTLIRALKGLLRKGIIQLAGEGKYKVREERMKHFLPPQHLVNEWLMGRAKRAVKELARFPEVVAVFLLGSVAQGVGSRDSDLDLLVITNHCGGGLQNRISKTISRLSTRLGIPINPSFLSGKGAREHRRHLVSGILLFDKSGKYSQKSQEEPRPDKQKIAVFLKTANHHLQNAELALERGVFYDAVHHSVSAVENAADAFILRLGGTVPHAHGDADAIEHLARRARPALLEKKGFRSMLEGLRELEKHTIKSKYPVEVKDGVFLPPQEFYTKDEARRLFRKAQEVVRVAEDFLKTQ